MKLPAAFATIAIATSILVGVVGYSIARNAVVAEAEGDLLDLTIAHKAEIDEFLDHVDEDLELLSTHPWTIMALRSFASGWQAMGSAAAPELGRLYGAGGEPYESASLYARHHEQYDPWLTSFAEQRGYADIYLMSINGDVLYSVAKEEDFATNLIDGPYSDTGFGRTFRRLQDQYRDARATRDRADLHEDELAFSDFDYYAPNGGTPVAFHGHILAGQDGELLGALFVQLSEERLQETIGVKAGFGEDGETILVGADRLLRSESVRRSGAILEARIDNAAVTAALDGQSGVLRVPDWSAPADDHHADIDIVAYLPIEVLGLDWALLGIKPVEEVMAPVHHMALDVTLTAAGATLLVILVGILAARQITRPILSLAGLTRRVVDGETGIGVPHLDRGDEVGEMARALDVFKDDAERVRRLGEAVEAERRTLHEVLDSAPEPMFVIDQGGTILRANIEAERAFEYEPGTLVGQSIDSLVPDDVRGGHAALRDGFVAERTMRTMRGGRHAQGAGSVRQDFPRRSGLEPPPGAGRLYSCDRSGQGYHRTAQSGA